MQSIIIEVKIIGKDSANNSIDLLIDIENNIGNLNIKKTYIIPTVPQDEHRFIPNIFTNINHGEYKTTLSFKCDNSYIDFARIDKFQFLFVGEEYSIKSNIIDMS